MKRVEIPGLLLCLSAVVMFISNAQSALIRFESAPEQTTLLELYTSEGCSSCPPAEAWLSGLKSSPGLWKNFVPLAFHVDYWDGLGWPDPLAARAYSDRQRNYAGYWRTDGIYTPCFVRNGREWRDWRSEKEATRISTGKAGVLTVTSSDTNHWQVSFIPAMTNLLRCEVHASLLGGSLSSDVKAGENRGRRLNHDFAVLKFVNGPMMAKDGNWRGELDLPRGNFSGGTLAVAVWVTHEGDLEPLQATGGWLKTEENNL